MAGYIVSVIGKGGCGKSTVAQGLAVEAARRGSIPILADMDEAQKTSVSWAKRRREAGVEPYIEAELVRRPEALPPFRRLCDLLVVDTPGRADHTALSVAQACELIVVPAGTNIFELEPAVKLMGELRRRDLYPPRVVIALTKVPDAEHEADARSYLRTAGYEALPEALAFNLATHDIGNEGRAVNEANEEAIAEPARHFFDGIRGAIERSVAWMVAKREAEEERRRGHGKGGHER